MKRQSVPHLLAVPVGARDHVQGAKGAPVTLVEYGDYECPHCGRAYPIVKAVQHAFGTRLRFVFRNFPLGQMHPHAESAAEAAEAAAAQGKFWEMHDALYEHQDALEPDNLVAYADKLRLAVKRFAADLEKRVHASRVREDFQSGVRSGVKGTPTFFINGARFDGSWDVEGLSAAIEDAVAE
jgi:protein-disulfide isomerase